MSHMRRDESGYIVLTEVTPVITALFRGYDLKEPTLCDGRMVADFEIPGEDAFRDWDKVGFALGELAEGLGLDLPEFSDVTIAEYLYLLGAHFGAGNASAARLGDFIKHTDFSDRAGAEKMFDLAKLLDDGHGLTAMEISGHGFTEVYGRDVALNIGVDQDHAFMPGGDMEQGVDVIVKRIDAILATVEDDATRAALRAGIGQRLSGQALKGEMV